MAMLLVACGRDAKQNESTAVVEQSAAAVSSSPAAKPPCPPTGKWAACSVIDRLDRAGLAPIVDSAAVDEPPLTPKGVQIAVGKGVLEVYVYPDVKAREREQGKLDKTKYVSFDAALTMEVQPTLIHNANLIAILHSRNDHLRERVADAITAGPPQPPSHP